MKKIVLLLAVIGMFGFQGCEGPEGPPGQDGLDGQNGPKGDPGYINEVFEVTMNFTTVNNYGSTFPLNLNIYSDDNLLVYELVNTNNGIDSWALLPQIYYFNDGAETAQYNYNFSYDQFSIFIDASFPLTQLPTTFTTNKTFRIVIIPGKVNSTLNSKKSLNKEDYSDYNAVISKYKIDDSNVKKLN